MKQKRCKFLPTIGIIIAILTPAAGMTGNENDEVSRTQSVEDQRKANSPLAATLDRFVSHLKELISLQMFNPNLHFTGYRNTVVYPDLPQPETRSSAGGALYTTLPVQFSTHVIVDPSRGNLQTIRTTTYETGLLGPTLRVKPGDILDIQMPNYLPQNPEGQRTGSSGAFPHDPYTTNLHTHGLTVSPEGISDNIFRQFEPGKVTRVRIHIPPDHQTGTFWYHPHKHGSVSYQFFGGMSGFLIIEGGKGTLDDVPEVKAAKEVLMGFQVIRTGPDGNQPYVFQNATSFSSSPDQKFLRGVFGTYGNLDPGQPGSLFFLTTNGVTNPILEMSPGEVHRWRLLNAASGETLVVALEDHALNIIANDGITVPEMVTLEKGQPIVMGAGNRVDVLVKAGKRGIYRLQALAPKPEPNISNVAWSVITQSGIDPAERDARTGHDLPFIGPQPINARQTVKYPYTLAIIKVSGPPKEMALPQGLLPVPTGIPSIETMLNASIDKTRHVAFENCGIDFFMRPEADRLPSCEPYFERYDAAFWDQRPGIHCFKQEEDSDGNIILVPLPHCPMANLLMMRDDDDCTPNQRDMNGNCTEGFTKAGIFTPGVPLFDDMYAGNFEEWTIINRTFSDHPFHIHLNPFLVTHINGMPLPQPEWRDTILVPAAQPGPDPTKIGDVPPTQCPIVGRTTGPNPCTVDYGSITYRTYYDPVATGNSVMHCHILTHEDVGMMQQIVIKP